MDRYTIFHSNINSKDETLIVCKHDFNIPNTLWDHWIDGSVTTNASSLKEAVQKYFKAFKILQMSCAEGTSKQEMDRLREKSAKRKKMTREEAIKNIRKEMCRDCDYYYLFDGNCSIDCYVTDSVKVLERSSNNDIAERKD